MTGQKTLFDAAPDLFLPTGPSLLPELDAHAELLPGPYRVSMTRDLVIDGWAPPFTVVGATGQAVAGHIPSKAIADKVAAALNAAYPAEEAGTA